MHIRVQRKMPGLVPPYAVYLHRSSHWVTGNRKGDNGPLNALVKINIHAADFSNSDIQVQSAELSVALQK